MAAYAARRNLGQRRRRRRLRRGGACHAGVLPAVRRARGSRPPSHRRRTAGGRAADRRRQPRVLDEPARRGPRRARTHAEIRPAGLHDHRRPAARVPLSSRHRRVDAMVGDPADGDAIGAQLPGGRPPEGRRHARPGAIGNGHDRVAARTRVPPIERGQGRRGRSHPRSDGPQRPHDADPDLRRRRRGAADRVRQRQQPAARPSDLARPRARHPRGPRREPRPRRASADHGERSARVARRRRQRALCGVGYPRPGGARARRAAAHQRGARRPPRPGVRVRRVACGQPDLRARARAVCVAERSERRRSSRADARCRAAAAAGCAPR